MANRRRIIVLAAAYSIPSIISTQLPLLHYLGYEFSVLTAILAAIICGIDMPGQIGNAWNRPGMDGEQRVRETLAAFRNTTLGHAMLLVIPFGIMLINALFVRNCSLLEGGGFYLLIPLVTVVFSSVLAFFASLHYHRARLVFFSFFGLTVLYAVMLGYWTPAIFSYNFFYGYFPGLSYDETLSLDWPLIASRLLTLVVAAILYWLATLVLRFSRPDDSVLARGRTLLRSLFSPAQRLTTLTVALFIVVVYVFRQDLGFESTASFVRQQLGARWETEHFVIYYAHQSIEHEEIRWIAEEHEFRLHQISTALALPYAGKIESYIYPSAEMKQKLLGAGNTNFAKPWSGQIHITKQSIDQTLKHELVHVALAPFGAPVIKASLSTGIVEGVAMALEWDWGNRTLHEYAAVMKRFRVSPDVRDIISFAGFATQSSSISYVLAGSFCRFLIERYGIRKMTNLYRSVEFERVYGKPLDTLVEEWDTFLKAIPVSDQERDVVDVLFRRPAIFQKICPRTIANRERTAAAFFREGKYSESLTLYKMNFDEAGSYGSLAGYTASAFRLGQHDLVINILDSTVLNSERPMQYLPLFVLFGDAALLLSDNQRALDLYERVRCSDIAPSITEASTARLLASRDTNNAATYLRYFVSMVSDTVRVRILDDIVGDMPLAGYLKGRSYFRQRKFEKARDVLAAPLEDPYLEAMRLRTTAMSLFYLREFQKAKAAFWQSLNHMNTPFAKAEVYDWVERCEWMSSR